ncbi:Solute carrier family 26 member 6 [Merluccius polli]|uniref:Solute carrier family 26 member 6 n=1 Tax=Merluccius polli TaxID=89951 RepID=A0AA47MEW5_MERPO|nr:Solute carrier family 26 member 6 [Merluccius polli]
MPMGVPSSGDFCVQRRVLVQSGLDELGRRRTRTPQPLDQRVKDRLRCSVPRLKQMVLGCVPVLSWLPQYSIKENAVGDVVSGLSVGIMHLPQGMAYALLASLAPVFGLYTSFYPVLIYFIFGTSRHISIGTFAVVSIMVGSVTEKFGPDSLFMVMNGTNGTGPVDIVARDAYRVQIASAVTAVVGVLQILFGLVRFGFVVTYLSEPLVRGYTTAVALQVLLSQLKYVIGVDPKRYTGPLSQIYTLIDLCSLLPKTNIATLVVSLVALFVLILVKELNACYRKKIPLPIPIELIVLIVATIVSYFAQLRMKYEVDVVGEIPSGLKAPQVPDGNLFVKVVGDAFAIVIVAYAISISISKTMALKHGYTVDSNQELIALGLSNVFGAFFQCYCVTASLSRSLVQESTGGKTQVAGVVSSIIVLITVLKIGSLFAELPKAILATIVFVNLKGMFKQFHDIPTLWRSNKVDLMIWSVTWVATLLLNLDVGLAVAVVFAMLTVIFRIQLPRYSILGHVPGTELYVDTDSYEEAKQIPGITIFRSSATICYTNAEMYLDALQKMSGINIVTLLTEKKRLESKLKRQQEKEKKKAKKAAKKQENRNMSEQNSSKEKKEQKVVPTDEVPPRGSPTNAAERVNGRVNHAYQDAAEVSVSAKDTYVEDDDDSSKEEADVESVTHRRRTHSVILDLSTTSFVDTVTAKTLSNIFKDFGEIDVCVYLAGCQVCIVQQLKRAGVFSESILLNNLFVTVHDAVLHTLETKALQDCGQDMFCITKM